MILDFMTVNGFYEDRHKSNVLHSYFLNEKKNPSFNSKINWTSNISGKFHQFIPNNFFVLRKYIKRFENINFWF